MTKKGLQQNMNLLQQVSGCRVEVLKFAVLMEKVLKENDHKGSWKDCTLEYLNNRLFDELRELQNEIFELKGEFVNKVAVTKEAVDVANFCMFIVDDYGNLNTEPDSKEVEEQ